MHTFCEKENRRKTIEWGVIMDIKEWNESRMKTKEEIQFELEKQAWKDLMRAIGDMGGIPSEPERAFYKIYHKKWEFLIDKARYYKAVAKLNEKYGLDEEV